MTKVVILYAHPNPASFNHAILETVQEVLKNCDVTVRDLYAINFPPVLIGSDFQGKAPEVAKEQEILMSADFIVVIHPIWWWSFPTILKGYFDRVLSYGFAYKMGNGKIEGLLTKQKVIVINTWGNAESNASDGISAMKAITNKGIWSFCGAEVLEHKMFFSVPYVTQQIRQGYLDELKNQLPKLIHN